MRDLTAFSPRSLESMAPSTLALLVVGLILAALVAVGVLLVRRAVMRLAAQTVHSRGATTSIAQKATATTSSDAPATPHKRGVAHLVRYENEQAVGAFTEAIQLDPDGPNAYIGRAMAYRRLGDMTSALQDEQTAQELGGAERTAWDRLVNRSRKRWSWDFDNPDWRRVDRLSRNAVLLRMLNSQILNGGLYQWVANGYIHWLDDVIEAAAEVGTDAAKEVAAMLREMSHIDPASVVAVVPDDDVVDKVAQKNDAFNGLWDLEDRYYQVQNQFVRDVENWFEEKATEQASAQG